MNSISSSPFLDIIRLPRVPPNKVKNSSISWLVEPSCWSFLALKRFIMDVRNQKLRSICLKRSGLTVTYHHQFKSIQFKKNLAPNMSFCKHFFLMRRNLESLLRFVRISDTTSYLSSIPFNPDMYLVQVNVLVGKNFVVTLPHRTRISERNFPYFIV